MPTCSAFNCSYNCCRGRIAGRTIHRFPFSRPEILMQWIVNIRRDKWRPSRSSVICSSHFEPDCFDRTGQLVRLKPDAVPTVFDFPSHVPKVTKKKISPLKRKPAPLVNDVASIATSSILKDHSYSSDPQNLKRELEEEKKKCELLKKKIRTQEQSVTRLKKKVSSLFEVVNELQSEKSISENAAETVNELSRVNTELLNRSMEYEAKKYDPVLIFML